MTNRITINGIPSSEKQLFVNKLDKLPVAVEKVETYSVGGRADNLHRPTAKYNDLKYTVKCVHIGNNTDDAVRYLTEAETLITDLQPDRYATVTEVSDIKENRIGNGAIEITVTYTIAPFKYAVNNDFEFVPQRFKINGTMWTEPVLKIVNIADECTITLNGITVHIDGLSGNIYIDVENKLIYQLIGGEKVVVQENTSGDFWNLILIDGDVYNTLEFSGADNVLIQKNERWK